MRDLDVYDLRILAAMQAQADLTQAEIAERVYLSGTQCGRRIARLRQEGYIQRIAAVLDHKKLGLAVVAHTLVSLRAHDDQANAAFRKFVAAAREVVECYAQTGDADYIMKIYCRDLDHLGDVLDRLIKAAGGLAVVRSSIVLKEIKAGGALPID